MSTPQDEMRAKFEAWATGPRNLDLARHPDNQDAYWWLSTVESWAAWQAATAAQAEALAAVTRERDALRKAVAPLLQDVVNVCTTNHHRVVVATVQRRMCISWGSAEALCIEAHRQGLFDGFDTSALYPLKSLTPTAPGAQEQA